MIRQLVGDVRAMLPRLPDASVQCVVTSPPYWGLRDYGVEGQIGLEATPAEYVAKMVEVFREVRRVLRDDGTLWLNLGDCYATCAGKVGRHPGGGERGERWVGRVRDDRKGRGTPVNGCGKDGYEYFGPMTQPNRLPLPGLKPKDLVGVPWRVAFALQDDGWWLRSDIIWHKPSPMPESVQDRPSREHEYLFLLTKAERYLYDADAIVEPCSPNTHARLSQNVQEQVGSARANGGTRSDRPMKAVRRKVAPDGEGIRNNDSFDAAMAIMPSYRNKRTVWKVAAEPFKGAHFATFPPALVEPCILAGTRKGDTVLDPFGGAGTTGLVADRLGRDAILIELNPAYAAMSKNRIIDDAPLFVDVAEGGA